MGTRNDLASIHGLACQNWRVQHPLVATKEPNALMAHMGLARNFGTRITMPFWEIIKIISIKWQEGASSGHVGNE